MIRGLTYDQLSWRGLPILDNHYKPNNNEGAKKRPKKTMTYKVSKKSEFPYPELSYDEHVTMMDDRWLTM